MRPEEKGLKKGRFKTRRSVKGLDEIKQNEMREDGKDETIRRKEAR